MQKLKTMTNRAIEQYKKLSVYAKKHPKRTIIIAVISLALLVGIAVLIKAYLGLILFFGFALWCAWDYLFPEKPKVDGSALMIDCIFHAVLDLYGKLQTRRPKTVMELNQSEYVNDSMSFWLVKEHPNAPIDADILEEGQFLLDDKARHYSNENKCIIHITSVSDEGGYVKIIATFGDAPVEPVTVKMSSCSALQDEDF